MKLVKSFLFDRNNEREFTITQAFEHALVGTPWSQGTVETAVDNIASIAYSLGTLVEKLNEIGVISDDAVIDILNGSFRKLELS